MLRELQGGGKGAGTYISALVVAALAQNWARGVREEGVVSGVAEVGEESWRSAARRAREGSCTMTAMVDGRGVGSLVRGR